jgi:predicted O-linked N-acetylglucosamine transferase (SPINDLY family)
VEGSVLWLLRDNDDVVRNLKREAQARGVAPARLVFAQRTSPAEHLARQKCADLFLDTLPYNAHTTASDALFVGLPVVTALGTTFAGRVAASLLRAAGMAELVTESLEDYEALALKLAREPALLAAAKARLVANRDSRALFDTARFTRNLEGVYQGMWERSQRGEAPESFAAGEPAPPP